MRTIVSVAVNQPFEGMQSRQLTELEKHWTGPVMFWKGTYPAGCPTHQSSPYHFKIAAMRAAIAKGLTSVLWMDSSCLIRQQPDCVFERIEKDGALIVGDGWTVAQWCTDEVLRYFNLTREDAHKIPLNYAITMGFDFGQKRQLDFLDQWEKAANSGCFKGPARFTKDDEEYHESLPFWPENARAEVEKGNMAPGHRHDQTVASILIHQLGLPYGNAKELFTFNHAITDASVIVAGH